MMRRVSLTFLILIFSAASLSAQHRRQPVFTTDPDMWVSGGIAGFRGETVNDGKTGSSWAFGNSTNLQYAASLEKTMGNGGFSLGLAGSYAHVPFVYNSLAGSVGASCNGCDAHLDMTTLMGTFHAGAGSGFHQVVELNAGIVNYANLKRDADGAALAGGTNTDPVFSFGWGFAYGFDDRTEVEFVPDWGIALHERDGVSNGVSNTNTLRSFRVSFRKGFGARKVHR